MQNGKKLNTYYATGIVKDINNLAEELIKEFKDSYNDSETGLIDFLENDGYDMARHMVLEHFADVYSLDKGARIYEDITKMTLTKVAIAIIFANGD